MKGEQPIKNIDPGEGVTNSHQPSSAANNDEDQIKAERIGDQKEAEATESRTIHDAPSDKAHVRQPSLSVQSQLRSSNFRRTSVSQTPSSPPPHDIKSPILPILSAEGESINDIYRKQTLRLDELEKENKRLAKEARDVKLRLEKAEEELEDLRESSAELGELRMRATKVDAQTEEIDRLVRSSISCSQLSEKNLLT